MKERPILFSGAMVRAILAGTKTQTRRVVKSPSRNHTEFVLVDAGSGWWPYFSDDGESHITDDGMECPIDCPYGIPGDRLWVRETWKPVHSADPSRGARYRADIGIDQAIWRPSIHMPRWASRITLEVKEVRVERLQAISAEDCIAEGMSTNARGHDAVCELRLQYQQTWESLNGPGSWDENPWVWCVSFNRSPA